MEIHWNGIDEISAFEKERIEERIRSLDEEHADLIDVRIAARSTNHHRHGGQEVHITCEARGQQIVASRDRAELGLSLNEALDAFEREVRRMREKRMDRSTAPVPAPPVLGTVRRIFPDRGYGFVRTDEGKEVYFHKNAVHGGLDFKHLQEGQRVALDVEHGHKGLQAITINPPLPELS
jgi:cold shock CspA family protein/ribosome-associated translation inhibitor RaiA